MIKYCSVVLFMQHLKSTLTMSLCRWSSAWFAASHWLFSSHYCCAGAGSQRVRHSVFFPTLLNIVFPTCSKWLSVQFIIKSKRCNVTIIVLFTDQCRNRLVQLSHVLISTQSFVLLFLNELLLVNDDMFQPRPVWDSQSELFYKPTCQTRWQSAADIFVSSPRSALHLIINTFRVISEPTEVLLK